MKYIKKFEGIQSDPNDYFTQAEFDLIEDIFLDLVGSNQHDKQGGIQFLSFVPGDSISTGKIITNSKIQNRIRWIVALYNPTEPVGNFVQWKYPYIAIDRDLVTGPHRGPSGHVFFATEQIRNLDDLNRFFDEISTVCCHLGRVKCSVFQMFDKTLDFRNKVTNIYLDKIRGLRYYGFLCLAEFFYTVFTDEEHNQVCIFTNIKFHIQKR